MDRHTWFSLCAPGACPGHPESAVRTVIVVNAALSVSLADIEAARERIGDRAYCTPMALSKTLSERHHAQIYLKLENLQMSGAFKERGALNKLLQLSQDELRRGVIVASAGNHAQGVAYHGVRLGAPVTVVMPENSSLTKVSAVKRYGAQVILVGTHFEDALAEALRRTESEGLTFIHPFNDPAVIAGQGTIGLEMLEQCPQIEAVIVPVGGGGLISGVATAIKARKSDVRIIGVEARAIAAAYAARRAGKRVEVPPAHTIADGIAVQELGSETFPIIQALVDEIVVVDEAEIAAAVLCLLEDEKTVAEGAGAAPLAAIMHRALGVEGRRVGLLISGGNIDIALLTRIIDLGRVKSGRLLRLSLKVGDQPGTLANVSRIIAERRANIMQIYHSRDIEGLLPGEAQITLHIETRGFDHIAEVKAELEAAGYAPM